MARPRGRAAALHAARQRSPRPPPTPSGPVRDWAEDGTMTLLLTSATATARRNTGPVVRLVLHNTDEDAPLAPPSKRLRTALGPLSQLSRTRACPPRGAPDQTRVAHDHPIGRHSESRTPNGDRRELGQTLTTDGGTWPKARPAKCPVTQRYTGTSHWRRSGHADGRAGLPPGRLSPPANRQNRERARNLERARPAPL